ncbi:MAG: hypothetical protein HQM12_00970 [SAR324 cluster bacterium]|nr:hypothetical protein [SAR324 cluster bacterium]
MLKKSMLVILASIILALPGSMLMFYLRASPSVHYFSHEETRLNGEKKRVLITAGSGEYFDLRFSVLQQLTPDRNMTVQMNMDRNLPVDSIYVTEKWKPLIQKHFIPNRGTAWELQEALLISRDQQEWLLVPMIPERALKLYFLQGDKEHIRVMPIKASFPRKTLEFVKSWLGWVFPDFVNEYRRTYYNYEDGSF